MVKRTIAYLMMVTLGVLAGPAVAHEGHSHGKGHKVTGTVSAVHADMNHVEMTGTDGKKHEFYVSAATKYLKGASKLALADLTPGTRVVVEMKMDGQRMVATTVRVGAAAKAATKSMPQK